jgi:putative ABC transport system ATP-binding protein
VAFGPTTALDGLSFGMAEGEIVALVGPSGSGKSTLLHCLSGIMRPDRGEVWFDGHAIHTLGERDRSVLRRTVFGVIFERVRWSV